MYLIGWLLILWLAGILHASEVAINQSAALACLGAGLRSGTGLVCNLRSLLQLVAQRRNILSSWAFTDLSVVQDANGTEEVVSQVWSVSSVS